MAAWLLKIVNCRPVVVPKRQKRKRVKGRVKEGEEEERQNSSKTEKKETLV